MRWADPDLPELERAALLVAERAPDPAILVEVLNEPLALVPRLALDRLRELGDARSARVAAIVDEQRLRWCSHGDADLVADIDTAATGRARCASCDAITVDVDRLVHVAADVPACALFRGPLVPYETSWLLVDERRVEPRPSRGAVFVGGGPSDDVQNAGLPAAALAVSRHDDVLVVECAPGMRALWRPRRASRLGRGERFAMARDVFVLTRATLTAPLSCELVVIRDHDVAQRAVVIAVDGADGLATELIWVGYQATAVLRVGDAMVVSFDGAVRVHRTGDDVVVEHAGRFTRLPPGELVPLSLGDATAVWRGRQIELRGCPPPVAQAPRVNLLVGAARR